MTAANAHTPGEWTVQYDGPSLPIIMGGTQVVAHVRTNEADARLLASAPALLAALQAFVAEWDNTYDAEVGENGLWRSNQPMDVRVIEQARAALAQAQKGA